MSSIDWSKAPEGTTHTNRNNLAWFKFEPDGTCWYDGTCGNWLRNGCVLSDYDTPGELIERPAAEQAHVTDELLCETRYLSRDEIAMAAMQGLLGSGRPQIENTTYAEFAKLCYDLADAMLAESAK